MVRHSVVSVRQLHSCTFVPGRRCRPSELSRTMTCTEHPRHVASIDVQPVRSTVSFHLVVYAPTAHCGSRFEQTSLSSCGSRLLIPARLCVTRNPALTTAFNQCYYNIRAFQLHSIRAAQITIRANPNTSIVHRSLTCGTDVFASAKSTTVSGSCATSIFRTQIAARTHAARRARCSNVLLM